MAPQAAMVMSTSSDRASSLAVQCRTAMHEDSIVDQGRDLSGALHVRIDGKDFTTQTKKGEDSRMALARFVNQLKTSGYTVSSEFTTGNKASISIRAKDAPEPLPVQKARIGPVSAGTSGLDIKRLDGNQISMSFAKNGKDLLAKDGHVSVRFSVGNDTVDVGVDTKKGDDARSVMTKLTQAIKAKGFAVNSKWTTDGATFSIVK